LKTEQYEIRESDSEKEAGEILWRAKRRQTERIEIEVNSRGTTQSGSKR
jgi:hypothetical protein